MKSMPPSHILFVCQKCLTYRQVLSMHVRGLAQMSLDACRGAFPGVRQRKESVMNMSVGAAISVLAVSLAVVAGSVAAIVPMISSLRKPGDERRRAIVQGVSATTLVFAIAILMLASVWKVVCVFALDRSFGGINPISTLAIVAVFYLVQVHRYKKKFGD